MLPLPQRSWDQQAFETKMVSALPILRGREGAYFARNAAGDYVHPEAQLAFLGFKLGGVWALDSFKIMTTR
jgi:hypothetical protein